ncbi:MAG: Ig-like domain-containing protein, partial [Methanobacteriaceae archaeon]|nr:Ig-like domain-containing protein [Methanobacteriaceae archaeon]
MNKKAYLLLVTLMLVFVFCGSSAVTAADPTNNTINGTITIKEYNAVTNLTNATVTVNASGKVLGTATTDQNGYYSINFFSNQTKFNVTANFVGCNSINQTVTITKGAGSDPNYYGTANMQLTPKTIWWTGVMGASTTVYIKHYGDYNSAGQLEVTDGVNFYYAYCIDIYTSIGSNDLLLVNGPLPGTRGDLPTGIDWAKVNYIVSHYDPSTTANPNIEGAAIQCAIWYFTSAPYGVFPVNNPSYSGYYQFMTYDDRYNSSLPYPYDGQTYTNYGTKKNPNYNMVEDRAWQIINAALAMQYPNTVELSPDTIKLENGGTLNLTAVVKDQNGNPLNNITVNFTSTSGTFNATSGVTNALGIVKVSISGLTPNMTNMVTASISGIYGTLLYDNPLNPKQNLVAANVLPFTISDTSYITSDAKSNVSLSQTVTTPVNVGGTVIYTVTATNKGPNTATGIVIQDLIPAGLSNVVVSNSSGTSYNNGLWIIPTLNNGASVTLTITGTATAAMAGLNTTNVATRIAQDQYNEESNTTSARVYTKKADVSLSQTVNGVSSGNLVLNVGDRLTYIITASNSGPDAATQINIRDLVPGGLTGVTVTPSVGTYNATTGIWTIPSLANGTIATLNITGLAGPIMAGNNTTNAATVVSQNEYDPTVPSTTSILVYTKKANVVLSQAVNSPVNVGDTVKYIITALNNGPDTATNILIQDFIPALSGVLVTPSVGSYNTTTGIWSIPSLANGVSAYLNITGAATVAMAGNNTTNIATQIGQTEYNDAFSSVSAKVYTKLATVSITNTVNSGSLNVGQTGIFTVIVTNNGPDTVTNIQVTDLLPGFNGSVTIGSYDPSTGVWTIPSLSPGANTTLTLSGVITSAMAGTNITNHVTENQTESPFSVSVQDSVIHVKKANVVLSQNVNSPVNVGNSVVYVVTAKNNGPDNATNIVISDLVPAGLTGVTVTPSVGTYNSTTGVWTINSLASGVNATLTISGLAGTSMAGNNTTNVATQTGQTEFSDLYTSANATVYTKMADTKLSQTVTTPVNVGGTVTYIVTITNTGPDTATNFIIQDIVPAGLANYTVTPSTGTYLNGNWTIFSLANGANTTLTITGKVTAAMAGKNTTNTATKITETEYDPTTIGESVAADAYTNEADVVLTQTGSYNKNNVTFIVTARNNGPDNATEINIKDLIPNGLTGVIVTPSLGTYNSTTGIWYIPVLVNGSNATLNITGTATTNITITNTANKTNQSEYDSNTPDTNTYNLYVPSVDIVVKNYPWYYDSVTGYLDSYYVGNTPVMIVDVSNNGPDDATGVVVEYVMGNNFQFINLNTQGNGQATYNINTRTITWNIGSIPRGGFVFMKVYLYTIGSGNKTAAMTTTAKLVSVDQNDTNSTNDESSYGLYAPTSADIKVTQTYTTYTINGTQYVKYTITVVSNGPDNATGIKITDKLPTGLQYAGNSLSTDGGLTWTTNSSAYTSSNGV